EWKQFKLDAHPNGDNKTVAAGTKFQSDENKESTGSLEMRGLRQIASNRGNELRALAQQTRRGNRIVGNRRFKFAHGPLRLASLARGFRANRRLRIYANTRRFNQAELVD